MLNHHVVYRWKMSEDDAWALKNHGTLESFVASKIFQMLHPIKITVTDIIP